MDTKQILLEKNRSKFSVNDNSFIGLALENKARLLPFNNISETLNLRELYNEERDNCRKYRMIFTVNPICSNVLFNTKTEVVRYEGSSACTVLDGIASDKGNAINTTALDLLQAIRDTEYSHPDLFNDKTPYVYHCGVDIFNNHMLRSNDFVYVNNITSRTPQKDKLVFNTISDFVRNNDGENVQEDTTPGFSGQTLKDIHLYQYDTILSMYDAFTNRLKVKDGWYGFNNSTNVAIPNAKVGEEEISINKIMNNNKSCEFIDLYPDRSLYSFIPKINKYRRRIEKNWDYCITYPKYKDSDKVNEVCGVPNVSELNGGSSIKIVEAKRTYSNSGNNVVRLKTMFRHNLKVGDYITLYYIDDNNLSHFNNRIRVVGVGDYEGMNTDRYFTIQYKDITSVFQVYTDTSEPYLELIPSGTEGVYDNSTQNASQATVFENNEDLTEDDIVFKGTSKKAQFFYKKNVNGVDCQYYFRKFVKITKDNDGVSDLTSEINKLAYGENIYGDRVAQIVFTDDIDVEGLVDHRGKPLTDVYFTVIKRNAGHELWYDEDNFTDERVEFSHCFGKVTTGIDLPEEEYKYNVRRLNNIDFDNVLNKEYVFSKDLYEKDNSPLESDITIDSYNNGVYGDIVEYDAVSDYEHVLDIVQHRFNTMQRETLNKRYSAITYDELIADDYDFVANNDSSTEGDGIVRGFEISSYTINKSSCIGLEDKYYPGNLNPEGCFYNPYTKIKIREQSENVEKVIGQQLKYSLLENIEIVIDEEVHKSIILSGMSINYNLIKNDIIGLYNNETKELYWGVVYESDSNNYAKIVTDLYIDKDVFTIIKFNEGVPQYATYLPSSHSFVWRRIVPMSELPNDSDINSMPFTNGRNYIEKNINFFLKRQDPVGNFGLLNFDEETKYKSDLGMYRINGWKPIDLSKDLYNNGSLGNICL